MNNKLIILIYSSSYTILSQVRKLMRLLCQIHVMTMNMFLEDSYLHMSKKILISKYTSQNIF